MRRRGFSATTTVLGLICLMYAITYVDRVNVSTAASVFQKELHFSSVQVGLVFSAFAYPYLIFQIIGGWVSDRFGARLTLTVSAIIWAVATLLTGLSGGLTTMLCARVLLGLERVPRSPLPRAQCRIGQLWGSEDFRRGSHTRPRDWVML